MADLQAQLEITANAEGVETGVGRAKKSLSSLGGSAETAGKQASAGIDRIGTASARTSRNIDFTIGKLQLQAAALGKSASQSALLELRQKGASASQLASAAAALKTVDSFKAQEAAIAKAQAAATRYGAFLATAAVGAVVAFGAAFNRSLKSIDGFNDLKDATGASIENISALDRIARTTGGTFETVSSTLVKFNMALKDAQPDKGVGAVLKALNLDLKQLKDLDPAEALRLTAVALQGYADDANKARAVQELFGKSIKDAAPFLKDLAEAGRLQAAVTTKGAEEAEKFAKEMFKFQANADDLGRTLTIGLVTAMNELILKFREGRAAGKGFFEIGFDRYKENVRGFYEEVGLLEQKAAAFTPSFSPNDESAAEKSRLGRLSALPSLAVPADAKKTKGGGRGAGSDPLAEGKRYLESLEKQIEKTRELTVLEQAQADISSNRLGKLTPALRESILETAKQATAAQQAKEALEGMTKAREQNIQAQDRADTAALESVQQQIETNEALREEIELIGASVPARLAIEQARLSSAIAMKEETLAVLQNADASATQITSLEREIALLKERSGLLGQRAAVTLVAEDRENSKEFAKGVNDDLKRAFSDAFADTNNPIKAFGDSLYRTVTARIGAAVAESLATSVLNSIGLGSGGSGGGDVIGGFLSSIFGGPKADGGPVSAGRLYEVNERGPELLNVGSRQFLMMGNQGGSVTPNAGISGGKSVSITNYFNVPATVDRRTQQQIANTAGMAVQRAMARNG